MRQEHYKLKDYKISHCKVFFFKWLNISIEVEVKKDLRGRIFSFRYPPHARISRAISRPSSENFQFAIRRGGGVYFFWNNPMVNDI